MHQGAPARKLQFGPVPVGDIPRVVGTISSFEALRRLASGARLPCDIAEIRLDLIGPEHDDWMELCRRIEAAGTPALLTLRTAEEGGKSTASLDERLEITRRALPHVSALDVEHQRAGAAEFAAEARRQAKPIVASYHDFQRTPAAGELLAVIDSAAAYADVVKISTFVNTAADIGVLRGLLVRRDKIPLCIIGMGPLGTITRTEFPRLGSCLTYGYLDAPAAPGQLSAEELLKTLGDCRG